MEPFRLIWASICSRVIVAADVWSSLSATPAFLQGKRRAGRNPDSVACSSLNVSGRTLAIGLCEVPSSGKAGVRLALLAAIRLRMAVVGVILWYNFFKSTLCTPLTCGKLAARS